MSEQILSAFRTPDGQVFETKAEAQTHIRRPKILAAMLAVVDNEEAVANFLIDQREGVETAFDTGVIRRVSKSDQNKLGKAIDHLKTLSDPKLSFLIENADAVQASFRWPAVKRMDDAEKEAAAVQSLTVLCEGNTELAGYIYKNREGIVNAYSAGIEKRQPNPAAQAALAKYHEERKAKKAAEEAASASA
jgi:hypothetical protein